jgi:hypothetical protein
MKKLLFLLLILTKNSAFINAKTIEKSLSVYVIEEQINGIRFAHRSDFIDGKASELWAIDGRQVPEHEYEEAILNAEREERKSVRRQEEQKRKQEQEFKVLAQNNLIKKLLNLKIADITKELSKIKEPLLAPFLKFSEHSMSSEMALYDLEQEIEDANKLSLRGELADTKQLYTVFEKLEQYPEKLMKLYQDSINYAIKTCDNTRALKELLILVS